MKAKNLLFIMVGVIAITLLAVGLFAGIAPKVFAGDLTDSKIIVTDNVKVYDEVTKTATITDKANNVLVEAKLLTPLINEVGLGYQRVAEIEFETYEDFTDFQTLMSKIELYNTKEDMKSVQRTIDYKYKTYENKIIDDYTCGKEINEKTGFPTCEITGTHLEEREVWNDLDKSIYYTRGNLIIGLYTTTYEGETIEWIPTIANIKVEEWAGWTAGLNTDIVAYYKLDEGTGNAIDSVGSNDLTETGTVPSQTGKISTARGVYSSSNHFKTTDVGYTSSTTTDQSVSLWVYRTGDVGTQSMLVNLGGNSVTNGFILSLQFYGNNNYPTAVTYKEGVSQYGVATGDTIVPLNTWTHLVATYDASEDEVELFVSATSKATADTSSNTGADSTSATIGRYDTDASIRPFTNGYIDEVGMWGRKLTQTEITLLTSAPPYGISVNCQFSGYVFDENDNAFENINMSIINQDNPQEYYTDLTDGNGYWAINLTNSTNEYEVTARINGTTFTKSKSYISGQC